MTTQGRELLKETEAQFQKAVIDLAQYKGWKVAHFRPARTDKGWRTPVSADGTGFPDLLMIRGERIIVAELKSDKGKLTDAQREWLYAFAGTGKVKIYTWYPCDWDNIVETLD